MNTLEKAAQRLANGWCKDKFREDLPQGQSFCAMGALGQEMLGDFVFDETGAIAYEMERLWTERVVKSPEVRALAAVIREQYPDEPWHADAGEVTASITDAADVISFNDFVAKHSDEVVRVFEKAAVKMDESL